ncbi:MAG: 30S ribosomal protein S2 [bacterium]
MHKIPSIMEMLKAGAHFGHRSGRWHPKMAKYIFGVRNGIHVLDLEKTAEEIQKTLEYVKNLVAKGKNILFIGTKRQARELVIEAAKSCDMPYINERWIGGLLTNFEEMKRRLRKYNTLKAEVASGEIEKYTKKEQVDFKKLLAKMDRYLIGLAKLEKLPDALYIADLRTGKTAVTEANKTNVPIVAVCDTNVNPEKAQYIIPANDDAVSAIKMMAELVATAVNEGKTEYEKEKANAPKETVKKPESAAPVAKTAPVRKERRALRKDSSL